MSTIAPPQTDKVCPRCGIRQPLGQFRRRRRDSEVRCSECRDCRNSRERQARREASNEAFGRQIRPLASARSEERIVAIGNAIADKFGGPVGVSAEFHRHLARCKAAGKHAEVTRCLLAVLNLIRAADGRRRESELRRDERLTTAAP